jgi:uncharacterized protein
MTAGRVLTDETEIAEVVLSMKRVAILGMKTEAQRDQAAFYVGAYLHEVGVEIVPVPVYYPEVTTILGIPVVRTLAAISGSVDIVDVFRKSTDIPPHLPDILALRPKLVWFQLGIRNDEAAEALAKAGIDVVQDRCLLADHRRFSSP